MVTNIVLSFKLLFERSMMKSIMLGFIEEKDWRFSMSSLEESMMGRLIRWLRSSWVCKKCGREFHTMSFGYGVCICPNCYDNEQPFLFPDKTFLLNRLITRMTMGGAINGGS